MFKIKSKLVGLFSKFYNHENIQYELKRDINDFSLKIPNEINNIQADYALGIPSSEDVRYRDDIVFITSRFRSGSTLLWNLFRETGLCTSYYEPFNERRWFDPALRGTNTDATHRGVTDYWKEYDGLEKLNNFYDESWINRNLYMTEKSFAPGMNSYIDCLIRSAQKRPVLQFNRTDFRLSWLRANYPNSKIIHLYRNPRDQFYSFITNKEVVTKDNIEDTYVDAFYLDVWCKDLASTFPMLSKAVTPHPYQRFYYLWKLSWLWGKKYSDVSIKFENLVSSPKSELGNLTEKVGLDCKIENLKHIFSPPKFDTWTSFAASDWFSYHEEICERNLNSFLNTRNKLKL